MTNRIPVLHPDSGSHSISRVDPDREPLPGQSLPMRGEKTSSPVEVSVGEPTIMHSSKEENEQKRLDDAHQKMVATVAGKRKKALSQQFGTPPIHGGGQVDAMVDPVKAAFSGMSIYDAGVEKVRETHGDEAAEAARQDMANADYERVIREHGETERSSDDYYDRVKTEDGQEWLIDDDDNVTRVTGMSDSEVDSAHYPETRTFSRDLYDYEPYDTFVREISPISEYLRLAAKED